MVVRGDICVEVRCIAFASVARLLRTRFSQWIPHARPAHGNPASLSEQQRPFCQRSGGARKPATPLLPRTGGHAAARTCENPAVLNGPRGSRRFDSAPHRINGSYLLILVTRPEPTVRPPSRMAKPRPSSMAIGWISSTVISVLSPGMTISVPSGRVMTPVTSVVRK